MFEPNSLRCAPRHSSRMGVLVCDTAANSTRGACWAISSAMREKLNTGSTSSIVRYCRPWRRRSPSIDAVHAGNRKIPVVCFVHAILRLLPRPRSLRPFARARRRVPGRARGIGLGSIRESLFLFPLSLRGRVARRPLDGSQLSRKFRLAPRSSTGRRLDKFGPCPSVYACAPDNTISSVGKIEMNDSEILCSNSPAAPKLMAQIRKCP